MSSYIEEQEQSSPYYSTSTADVPDTSYPATSDGMPLQFKKRPFPRTSEDTLAFVTDVLGEDLSDSPLYESMRDPSFWDGEAMVTIHGMEYGPFSPNGAAQGDYEQEPPTPSESAFHDDSSLEDDKPSYDYEYGARTTSESSALDSVPIYDTTAGDYPTAQYTSNYDNDGETGDEFYTSDLEQR